MPYNLTDFFLLFFKNRTIPASSRLGLISLIFCLLLSTAAFLMHDKGTRKFMSTWAGFLMVVIAVLYIFAFLLFFSALLVDLLSVVMSGLMFATYNYN